MKRWQKGLIAAGVLALLAAGIGRTVVLRRAEQARLSAPPPAAVALELAPSDVVVVRVHDLARTLEVSGNLVAVNSAFVKARVAAEVKAVAVREGDSVKPGQVLAQLDPTEFDWKLRQAEEQARSARAQLEIAQRTLQNNRSLVQQGFISATALETAVSNEAAAQATLQAALAGVELARKSRGDATVTAPIAGQIAQRLVQPGERVPVDARLLEIVDLSRLELQAAIPPDEAGRLRVGTSARLQVDGIDAPVPARVVRINPSAQPGSRSVVAYLEVQPHPALRQGLYARGTIELDRRRALALPLAAVRNDQAQPYVLHVDGTRIVQRLPRLGERSAAVAEGATEMVEVLGGLAEGDRLLAGSVGAVRDGATVRLVETRLSAPGRPEADPRAARPETAPPAAPGAASAAR
jgi:RND family efflux transporter MFP subunit